MKVKNKEKLRRTIAIFLVINILFQIVSPTVAYGLTEGTYQPEYESFEPAGSSEMVDLFTGDFKYNIPLMDIDGYPINIAYHAGTNMEQEASWVGLGWSLNPGAINRNMRGLPDDFQGDVVRSTLNFKPQKTFSAGIQYEAEGDISTTPGGLVGASVGATANLGAGVVFNNYKGFGVELSTDFGVHAAGNILFLEGNVSAGVGATVSSLDGGSFRGNVSRGVGLNFGTFGVAQNKGTQIDVNTRSGDVFVSKSKTYSASILNFSASSTTSSTLPVTSMGFQPRAGYSMVGVSKSGSILAGVYGCLELLPKPPFPAFLGGGLFQAEGGLYGGYKGYFNKNELYSNHFDKRAYGYNNHEKADIYSLIDFNRAKDGEFYKETPNLPLSAYTYDVYSATAQGLGMNFRAQRNDVGIVYDPKNISRANDENGYGKVGIGLVAKVVAAYSQGTSINTDGIWTTSATQKLGYFKPTTGNNPSYEASYFKMMGEQTPVNASYQQAINSESPIKHQVGEIAAGSYYANSGFSGTTGNGVLTKSVRDIRNNYISYLSAKEASEYGFFPEIENYGLNNFTFNASEEFANKTLIARDVIPINVNGSSANIGVGHHTSQIIVKNTSGTRYIYGVPVYNKYKKSVVFNASDKLFVPFENTPEIGLINDSPLTANCGLGTVSYTSSEISLDNKRGRERLYNANELPAYAQSFLLSAIVSDDYIDVRQDGISNDDYGTYTKFNYTKIADYQWRTPFSTNEGGGTIVNNQAILDKGLISDPMDDKAFYEYGIKDLWYVHSIETKNYIAEFHISNRNDAAGVDNEHGVASTSTVSHMKKLDKIVLYTKAEKLKQVTNPSYEPVPIKTVSFEYDYSLCPGVYNNFSSPSGGAQETHTGKLTLKKIKFTYGSSDKGKLNPYEFYYGDVNHDKQFNTNEAQYNPSYNPKAIDRWGNYKPNNGQCTGGAASLNNDEFPYVEQNKQNADAYANAWNLTTMVTPTMAQINVDYESDDYSYVQNKSADQMVKIASMEAFKQFNPATPNNRLFNHTGWAPNSSPHLYMVIDLSTLQEGIPTSVSLSQANTILRNSVLKDSKIYSKCFTRITTPHPNDVTKEKYEYVPSYSNINIPSCELINDFYYTQNGNSYYRYAYVKLMNEGVRDNGSGNDVNPISLAAWQMLRLDLPMYGYPGSEPASVSSGNPGGYLVQILAGLGTSLFDMVSSTVNGQNFRFLTLGNADIINLNKSFARIHIPNKSKLGGGHRIKRITMSDSWNEMTSEETSNYGQEFDYKTIESTKTISSGVASYEPTNSGGDEISLRKPINFAVQHKYAPDNNYFLEEPLAESFYPAPIVGYSKVTIKPIEHDYNDNEGNANKPCGIGKMVYEFYTAKEFPVLISKTGMDKEIKQNPDIFEEFGLPRNAYHDLLMSQGYTVKLNNMHGILKGTYMFKEGDNFNPVSGTTFFYKTVNTAGGKDLNNTVSVVSRNGSISSKKIATEIDVTNDLRESFLANSNFGVSFYFKFSVCDIVPIFNGGHIASNQEYGLRYSSVTKLVQKYGVLEKVVHFDDKSVVTTENVLWDEKTGDVVMTKTINNNDNHNYNLSYPAYWVYDQMGHAYQNEGIEALNIYDNTDQIIAGSNANLFVEGDELAMYTYNATTNVRNFIGKLWVTKPSAIVNDLSLIDSNGNLLDISSYSGQTLLYKIIRSGRRNITSAQCAQITSLIKPVTISGGNLEADATKQIIDASATEFKNEWQTYCGDAAPCFGFGALADNKNKNPFLSGAKGNWSPHKFYSYKTNRNYNQAQVNSKEDGAFNSFNPFFAYSNLNSKWLPIYDPNHPYQISMGGDLYDRWVLHNEITLKTPFGNVEEEKDAIGRYHSTMFGYKNSLAIASASNAKRASIYYTGFEDVNYNSNQVNCSYSNQTFFDPVESSFILINGVAHTGRYSVKIPPGNSLYASRAYNNLTNTCDPNPFGRTSSVAASSSISCACLPPFIAESNSTQNKTHVISFWVKSDNVNLTDLQSQFTFSMTINSNPVAFSNTTKTPIINGWQKFDYEYIIPASNNGQITFEFVPTVADIYLDDFRTNPFNASMQTYVYDPEYLRLWAILDDRNFAQYYEYDAEGTLVRTKSETVKGIYTITEQRSGVKKK